MVLSEQQKKDLIERLKKGREQAKEKKLNEATTQTKISKSKSKPTPTPEPEPEPVKKTSSKKLEKVSDHESSSDTENSIDVVPDVKPKVKSQSVQLEEAFDQMKVKSKPIDIPTKKIKSEKEKPYLKIKLYKEPNNPNLINKFVNIINETEETDKINKNNHQEVKKTVESQPVPEKSEREKHLERLCRIYFN